MKCYHIDADEIIKSERVCSIEGYNGKYLISESGKVISVYRYKYVHGALFRIDRPVLLFPSSDSKGYLSVNLFDGKGSCKTAKVHRLVANAFLENPENKRCVCHKDNNPKNNHVDNLYWGTDKENQEQAWRDELHKNIMSVIQLTKDGNMVNKYISQSEAARRTNIPQQNIGKCISGKRKSAGGYLWRKSD